jgi:hypothetical protein
VTLSERIAREAPCAQARDIRALRTRAIALVNARRVPAPLQDPLLSGVNALSAQTPPCLPATPTAPTETAPAEPAPAATTHASKPSGKSRPGKHGGHGHGRGHK